MQVSLVKCQTLGSSIWRQARSMARSFTSHISERTQIRWWISTQTMWYQTLRLRHNRFSVTSPLWVIHWLQTLWKSVQLSQVYQASLPIISRLGSKSALLLTVAYWDRDEVWVRKASNWLSATDGTLIRAMLQRISQSRCTMMVSMAVAKRSMMSQWSCIILLSHR